MKEWIGYYENILTNELSENISLNSKGWKQSTYSNHKGQIKNSLNRVVMEETYIRDNMKYYVDLLNATKDVVKLYKEKPSFDEYKKQMKRVAGHEFGG